LVGPCTSSRVSSSSSNPTKAAMAWYGGAQSGAAGRWPAARRCGRTGAWGKGRSRGHRGWRGGAGVRDVADNGNGSDGRWCGG
jgi:hypothetical protein